MKQITTLLLAGAMLISLTACGTANETAAQETPETGDTSHAATLYFMADGTRQAEYELTYQGELTAQTLLEGLTALSGYQFSEASEEITADSVTVCWSDTASFMPGAAAVTPGLGMTGEALALADEEAVLAFMLDSAYITLRENLGVENIYFQRADGSAMDFSQEYGWQMDAEEPYTMIEPEISTGVNAFVYEDQRSDSTESGEHITPESAAQAVYDTAVAGYQGEVTDASWCILLQSMEEISGEIGYQFAVGQGSVQDFTQAFSAVVTDSGNIYLKEDGADDYSFYAVVPLG